MWYWILIRKPNTKTDRKTLKSERETAAVTVTLFETCQGNSNTRHNYSVTTEQNVNSKAV